MIHAGTARTDITPPIGIAHAGWGAQVHETAEGIDMPLVCTVLYLNKKDDGTEVVIIDVDDGIISVKRDREIRGLIETECGIYRNNIRLSYTHTHSGPVTGSSWILKGSNLIDPWIRSIPDKVVEAVKSARKMAVPARVGTSSGNCGININRRPHTVDGVMFTGRNSDGFVDREVLVTAIDDEDGEPIATIVNYACHPTIMGHENRFITPDYPGPMRDIVESTVGGKCLFLQGCAGNIGPIDGFTGDLTIYRKAGLRLGLEAARVRLSIDPLPRMEKLIKIEPSGADLGLYVDEKSGESDDTLSVIFRRINVPVKELPDPHEVRKEFNLAQKRLEEVRAKTDDANEIKKVSFPAKRAYIAMNLAEVFGSGGSVELPIQVIRVGNTALVALPVEPFAEIGVEIKRQSIADWTVVGGYSNGYYGYMPMRYAYPEGGYEVTTSPFAPEAAEETIESSISVIEELWAVNCIK